ncbi:MAG: histidine kinase [Clostridia bacterium]|nr:histidine kinase [Clostridia bacterium]
MSQSSFILNVGTQIICILLSLTMIIYFALKSNKSGVVYAYMWCMFMIFRWSFGQLLQAFSFNTQSLWLFEVFKLEAMCYTGLGMLIFCLFYAEHKLLHYKLVIILLFVPPTVSFIAALTNDLHHLFYPFFKYSPIDTGRLDFGVFAYYHGIVSYIYCIIGTYILIKYSAKRVKYIKKQFILLLCALIIPLVSNIILSVDVIQPDFDITPAAFTLSLVLFGIAIYKYKFLNIIPIALKNVVDNMKEAIMVINVSGDIVSLNNSFVNTFKPIMKTGGSGRINAFVEDLKDYIVENEDVLEILDGIEYHHHTHLSGELTLLEPQRKSYIVNIRPIIGLKDEQLGRVVSFNDISQYKMLMEELNLTNAQLSTANEQLKEHALTVEKLAVERERNRFARDAHDSVGHSMTLLITLLKLAQIEYMENPNGVYDKLTEAIRISRDGLNELRRSISGMKPGKLEENGIEDALKSLVGEFKNSGMEIQLSIDGTEPPNHTAYSNVLYRVCQEALTNSLRHGKARHVNIFLKFTKEYLKLYIFDDGEGCSDMKKGFGLKGMENRVKSLNGTVICGSGEDGGFNINVEIPLGGGLDDKGFDC